MSLELAAKHLASRGRNGDTELVHMSKGEVAGLQALAKAHGGKLTINPDTGLPEAFFLAALLPTLLGGAGATLGMSKLGIAALGAFGGALMNKRNPRMGAVMGGLGAFGGASLAGGLGAAGAASPAAAAQALGTPAATGAGSQAAMLAAQNAGFGQAGINALAGSAGTAAGAAPVATNVLSAGVNALGTEAGRSAALSAMGGPSGLLRAGINAAAPAMMQSTDTGTPAPSNGSNPYEYDFDPNSQMYTRVPVGTRQRDMLAPTTAMPRMMAAGGPIEEMSMQNRAETLMANGGQMFAAGGISNLGDYSDGGRLLKGPGDGVSDSIPATIADKRPARLADGEFVVPARIVSELGNGSTDAGARKLYAMMDRIQKARGKTTGKNRVAVNSRAEKLLPA
jgi:hypothetical protein